MSSMRNAVSRRPHKERSQPQNRQKWGILEKHKDYSLRAQDYSTKKRKLAILSQKSRERHPDEFAFGMLSTASAAQGKHTGKKEDENRLSHDAVKLLKTQDAGYLRTAAAQTRRELARIEQQVGMDTVGKEDKFAGQRGIGKKIVFDENGEPPRMKQRGNMQDALTERRESTGSAFVSPILNGEAQQSHEAIIDGDQQQPVSKSKKAREREKDALVRLKLERRRRKRLQEMRATKLELLRKKQRDIVAVADQLDLQRAKMARAVGGVNKNGVKFKIRERKR